MTPVCVNMYPAVCLPYYATRAQWKIFLAEGNGCVYNAIPFKRRLSSHAFLSFSQSRMANAKSSHSVAFVVFHMSYTLRMTDIPPVCTRRSSDRGQALICINHCYRGERGV